MAHPGSRGALLAGGHRAGYGLPPYRLLPMKLYAWLAMLSASILHAGLIGCEQLDAKPPQASASAIRVPSDSVRLVRVSLSSVPPSSRVTVPLEFTMPSSTDEHEASGRILHLLRSNPGIAGRFSDVLWRRWGELPGAYIVIGELGSMARQQGSITAEEWQGVLALAHRSTPPETQRRIEEIRRQVQVGSPVQVENLRIGEPVIYTEDEAYVVVAAVQATVDGLNVSYLTARKLMYSNGYSVIADINVNANQLGAADSLRRYIRTVRFSAE